MSRTSSTSGLWVLLTRSMLPTYGARANAAEGLQAVRRSCSDRAEAAAAAGACVPAQARPAAGGVDR